MSPPSNTSAPTVTDPDGTAERVVTCSEVTRTFSRGGTGGWLSGGDRRGETVTAVADVSLAVSRGEFVGLAGPSGSGKSTLLHLLAGLDVPTSGTVTLAGRDVGSLSPRGRTALRLDHVGVVFQHFHLLSSLSARANVATPLIELGHSKRQRHDRATTLLERVGLGDRIDHKPGELSGGERQRVAVARALSTAPDLVIADEPTGELDTATGGRVLDVLADVATDCAVIVASHDKQALDRAERVIRLRDGRREEEGEDATSGENETTSRHE